MVVSVKKYNAQQDKKYFLYCEVCRANGVDPQKRGTGYSPFERCPKNYGYIKPIYGGYIWARTKKALQR